MTEGGTPRPKRREASGRVTEPPNRPPRRSRDPRPFYKRGVFWFVVIVLEAVAAWIVTSIWVVSPTTVNVDFSTTDTSAFCAQVQVVVGQRTEAPAAGQDNAATFQQQADTMASLRSVAPEALQRDLERLQQHYADVAAYARELQAQSADGTTNAQKLVTRLNETDHKVELAGRRLDDAALRGCQIDLNAPTTTLPAGPGGSVVTSVPGEPGSSVPATPPGTG